MESIKHILVVSRMIPYSRKAIKLGISLARKYDAKLLILHLVSKPVDLFAINAPGLFPDEDYKNFQNSHQEAKEQLAKVIEQEINGILLKLFRFRDKQFARTEAGKIISRHGYVFRWLVYPHVAV